MKAWLQVLLSAVVLVVLMSFATWLVNRESLAKSGLVQVKQLNRLIFKEETRTPMTFGTSKHTHPSRATRIFDLQPSYNRPTGDQFSLSFRLKLKDSTKELKKSILLWGDPNYVKFKAGDTPLDHLLVFAPMIRIEPSISVGDNTADQLTAHKIVVYFNCVGSILNICEAPIPAQAVDLDKQGVLVTVTFADYVINSLSRGCRCNVFIGTQLAGSEMVPSESIRRNAGLLYIFPGVGMSSDQTNETTTDRLRVSELSYHNYDLTVQDVASKDRGRMSFNNDSAEEKVSRLYDPTGDVAYQLPDRVRD